MEEEKYLNLDEVIDYLRLKGWNFCKRDPLSGKLYLYKRFDTPTNCYCNYDKRGRQIIIYVSDLSEFSHVPYNTRVSFSMEICAETKSGKLVKFEFYSLPTETKKDIDNNLKNIPILLKAWEAVANT